MQNKDVGILGLAFKPNTNSVAGSASLRLAQNLIAKGARVRAYDPVAIPDAKLELNGSVHYCDSAYGAAEGVDALVVGTGWPEFRALDFDRIKHLLKRPLIVDTKNLLDSTACAPWDLNTSAWAADNRSTYRVSRSLIVNEPVDPSDGFASRCYNRNTRWE